MKVFINRRKAGYSGGIALVAANSAVEAHAVFATDERTKEMCEPFNYKTGKPESNSAFFDCYAYRPDEWEEVEGLEAHFGKPRVIDEDGWSE